MRPTPARIYENSPICVNPSAAFLAVATGYPAARTTSVHTPNLPAITSSTSASTAGHSARSEAGRISVPIETKKIATKMSLTGSTRASASCANSDSLMTNPARNAPRAIDNPSPAVSAAVPIATARATSKNSSMLRVWATLANNNGTARRASHSSGPNNTTASRSACPNAAARSPPGEARAGMSTVIATTARSSASVMPTTTRPYSVASSPRSRRNFNSTIVLATLIAAPATRL